MPASILSLRGCSTIVTLATLFTIVLLGHALPARSQDSAPPEVPASDPATVTEPNDAAAPAPAANPAPQPATSGPLSGLQAPAVSPPSAAPLPCTPCEEDDSDAEGTGAFLIGLGFFDLSSLNDRLAAAGYERIPSMLTVIGGEGHAIFSSGFVVGGMGAAILSRGGNGPDDVETEFGGGFGMVDLGFALVHTRGLTFVLGGGVGGYGIGLSIQETGGARFSEVLETPRRSATLGRGGVLASVMLRLEGKVPIGGVERGRQGFFALGLRAGGLYGPAMGHWSLDNGSEVTGDPDTALAGFYAALTLGFGGRRVTP